jgi:hypothetical protein
MYLVSLSPLEVNFCTKDIHNNLFSSREREREKERKREEGEYKVFS